MFPLSVTTSAPSSRRTVGVAGADIPFPQSTAIRRPSRSSPNPPRTRGPRRGSRRGCRRAPSRSTRPTPPGAPRPRRVPTARSASRSNSLPSRNSLIPLSVGGLCEAVSITPYRPCEACASAGVGSRPARSTRTPPDARPDSIAAAIAGPVTRPSRARTTSSGLVPSSAARTSAATARPTANASSGVTRVFGATADPRGSEQVHISGVGRRSLVVGCGSPSASLSYDGPRGFNSAADAATTDDRPNASTRVRLGTRAGRLLSRDDPRHRPGRGIDGWVRNLDDGRVEAVFEGPEDAVREMVAWCEMGSSAADVDGVDATYEEPEGLDGFEVRW